MNLYQGCVLGLVRTTGTSDFLSQHTCWIQACRGRSSSCAGELEQLDLLAPATPATCYFPDVVVVHAVRCTYWYLNLLLFTVSLAFTEVNESETNKNMEILWTYLERISRNRFVIHRQSVANLQGDLPNLPNLFETDVGISSHIITYTGLFLQISRWGWGFFHAVIWIFDALKVIWTPCPAGTPRGSSGWHWQGDRKAYKMWADLGK